MGHMQRERERQGTAFLTIKELIKIIGVLVGHGIERLELSLSLSRSTFNFVMGLSKQEEKPKPKLVAGQRRFRYLGGATDF